jgi:Rrf2 family transcriptional regulator, cysteine metabolism repressor
MKLSLCSEHALLTLTHLARQHEPTCVAEIARMQEIAPDALAEILSALTRAGYLEQAAGGFSLARSAETISVAEIIRLFDGALAPLEPVSSKGYAPAPMDKEEKLSGLFGQIQAEMLNRLEKATLAELV